MSRRRDLVVSYLPQEFMLDATKSVAENIRDGAKPVLDLIAEFESLPHDSKRHALRVSVSRSSVADPRLLLTTTRLAFAGGRPGDLRAAPRRLASGGRALLRG